MKSPQNAIEILLLLGITLLLDELSFASTLDDDDVSSLELLPAELLDNVSLLLLDELSVSMDDDELSFTPVLDDDVSSLELLPAELLDNVSLLLLPAPPE